jgi:DsbC/DsbD-like thiol-disulfide interchange protein
LVSDEASAIIKRYGLLNTTIEPGNRAYGVPHPGTLILDRNGIVTAKFFEEAYQERNSVASIFVRAGLREDTAVVSASTAHLSLDAAISDSTVAPGQRLTLAVDVTPLPGMHVYGPGRHGYQVVQLVLAPQPWLRDHATRYAPPQIYHFVPLNERVEVYSKPFRLTKDLTILATPEIQTLLAGRESITIDAALEYQACDDKVCFNPSRVPLSFTLKVKPLDRRPPG